MSAALLGTFAANATGNETTFCRSLVFAKAGKPGSEFQVFVFSLGLLQLVVFGRIAWIQWRARRSLRRSHSQPANTIVLVPPYSTLLNLFALTLLFYGVLNIVYDTRAYISHYRIDEAVLWGLATWYYHFVIDGVAFFLCAHGCGADAQRRAFAQSCVAGFIIAALFTLAFTGDRWSPTHTTVDGFYVQMAYEGLLVAFYWTIVLAPKSWFHRRDAVYPYAIVWAIYRVFHVLLLALMYYGVDFSYCGYAFFTTVLWGIVKPIVFLKALQFDQSYFLGTSRQQRGYTEYGGDNDRDGGGYMPLFMYEGEQTAMVVGARMDELFKACKWINYFEIKRDKLIDSGAEGKVYKGWYGQQAIAFKILFCPSLDRSQISVFCDENKLLCGLRHPNVVKFEGVCIYPPVIASVMEYCHMNLRTYLNQMALRMNERNSREIDFGERLPYIEDAINGVAFLHSCGIVHGDIKSFNAVIGYDIARDWTNDDVIAWLGCHGLGQFRAVFRREKLTGNDLVFMERSTLHDKIVRHHTFADKDKAALFSAINKHREYIIGRWKRPIVKFIDISTTNVHRVADQRINDYMNERLPQSNHSAQQHGVGDGQQQEQQQAGAACVGTTRWAAPELMVPRPAPPTFSSDIYALGVVFWEICTGQYPFVDCMDSKVAEHVCNGYRPRLPSNIDPTFAELLHDMWHGDAYHRPAALTVQQRVSDMATTFRYERDLHNMALAGLGRVHITSDGIDTQSAARGMDTPTMSAATRHPLSTRGKRTSPRHKRTQSDSHGTYRRGEAAHKTVDFSPKDAQDHPSAHNGSYIGSESTTSSGGVRFAFKQRPTGTGSSRRSRYFGDIVPEAVSPDASSRYGKQSARPYGTFGTRSDVGVSSSSHTTVNPSFLGSATLVSSPLKEESHLAESNAAPESLSRTMSDARRLLASGHGQQLGQHRYQGSSLGYGHSKNGSNGSSSIAKETSARNKNDVFVSTPTSSRKGKRRAAKRTFRRPSRPSVEAVVDPMDPRTSLRPAYSYNTRHSVYMNRGHAHRRKSLPSTHSGDFDAVNEEKEEEKKKEKKERAGREVSLLRLESSESDFTIVDRVPSTSSAADDSSDSQEVTDRDLLLSDSSRKKKKKKKKQDQKQQEQEQAQVGARESQKQKSLLSGLTTLFQRRAPADAQQTQPPTPPPSKGSEESHSGRHQPSAVLHAHDEGDECDERDERDSDLSSVGPFSVTYVGPSNQQTVLVGMRESVSSATTIVPVLTTTTKGNGNGKGNRVRSSAARTHRMPLGSDRSTASTVILASASSRRTRDGDQRSAPTSTLEAVRAECFASREELPHVTTGSDSPYEPIALTPSASEDEQVLVVSMRKVSHDTAKSHTEARSPGNNDLSLGFDPQGHIPHSN